MNDAIEKRTSRVQTDEPAVVVIVYVRDSVKGVWTGQVVGDDALRERGPTVRRVRGRLKRALERLHDKRSLEIVERVELSAELEQEVAEHVRRQRECLAEREALANERIVLAKRLRRQGVPLRATAEKLMLSGQRLGTILMEEGTGKRPPVRVAQCDGGAGVEQRPSEHERRQEACC